MFAKFQNVREPHSFDLFDVPQHPDYSITFDHQSIKNGLLAKVNIYFYFFIGLITGNLQGSITVSFANVGQLTIKL